VRVQAQETLIPAISNMFPFCASPSVKGVNLLFDAFARSRVRLRYPSGRTGVPIMVRYRTMIGKTVRDFLGSRDISVFRDCLDPGPTPLDDGQGLFPLLPGVTSNSSMIFVYDLCPCCCSIQQFPNAGGCFIQGVDALQVAHSLADRHKECIPHRFYGNTIASSLL